VSEVAASKASRLRAMLNNHWPNYEKLRACGL